MRVDNGMSPGAVTDFDPITRVRRYGSALRRRWYLVLIPAVLGAAFGWFSAPEAITVTKSGVPTAATTYYRASHILAAASDTTSSEDPSPEVLDLNRAAYLVNTGEVPSSVAEQLDLPVEEVRSSLLGLPRSQVTSVEVQAYATDQKRAVAMADAAAASLQQLLLAQATLKQVSAQNELQPQIDKLGAEIDVLNARIDTKPLDTPQLEAQRSTLTEQYGRLFQQQTALANQPPPTSGLTTLQAAQATTISKDDYQKAKKLIRDGADYVTGAPMTLPVEDGGGSSVGPSIGASRPTRAGIGFLLGIAVGVGAVLLLDRFDGRLRRRREVEEVTGLAVLSEIPPLSKAQQRAREVVAHTQHRSRSAESYRVVRGAMLYALSVGQTDVTNTGALATGEETEAHQATVIMVTSANPAEGKTTTVANLAAVLAEGGLSVLVINCDFRRPLIQRYLLHDEERSAAPATAEAMGASVVDTEIERVRLVVGIGEHSPEANPLDVVATQRKVIETARPRFDVILLDTAPFLTTNDASELLGQTDQVILVVRAGKTRAEAAARSAELLGRFDAPVLGIVLNDSDESRTSAYYYDGYPSNHGGAGAHPRPRRDCRRCNPRRFLTVVRHDPVGSPGGSPRQRSGLAAVEVDGWIVVHDADRHDTHVLDRAAATVWNLVDGARSIDEIVAAAVDLTGDMAAEVRSGVHAALHQLTERHLLDDERRGGISEPADTSAVLRVGGPGSGFEPRGSAPDEARWFGPGPRQAAGTTVEVTSTDEEVAAMLDEALSCLPEAAAADHWVTIERGTLGSPSEGSLDGLRASSRWLVRSDGADVAVANCRAEAVAEARTTINRIAIAHTPGRLLFHAGAVERNGDVVVVLGQSGSGKSTLVAALVRDGFNYLTDEVVVVHTADHHVEPFPKFIDLSVDSLALLGAGADRRDVSTGKVPIDPRTLGALSTGGRVALLVQLDPSAGRSEQRALSQGVTDLLGLMESTFAPTMSASGALQALARLVKQVDTVHPLRADPGVMATQVEALFRCYS